MRQEKVRRLEGGVVLPIPPTWALFLRRTPLPCDTSGTGHAVPYTGAEWRVLK